MSRGVSTGRRRGFVAAQGAREPPRRGLPSRTLKSHRRGYDVCACGFWMWCDFSWYCVQPYRAVSVWGAAAVSGLGVSFARAGEEARVAVRVGAEDAHRLAAQAGEGDGERDEIARGHGEPDAARAEEMR